MRYAYVALAIALALGGFAYGFIASQFRLPPYALLQSLYEATKDKPPVPMADFSVDESEIAATLAETTANAAAIRDRLIDRVIVPRRLAGVTRRDIDERTVEFTTRVYGVTTKGILAKSEMSDGRCLRAYIQGHGGNPFSHPYHDTLIKAANAAGCDFLSMAMIGAGMSDTGAEFPSGKYASQVTRLTRAESNRHGNYLVYHDKTLPQKDPIALFLTPHYYLLQDLAQNYETVSLMGISGGAWNTVWLAALLPEIDHSIAYAGTMPLVYRSSLAFHADFEEISSPIYLETDYWQLYVLAVDRPGSPGERTLHIVYSDEDPCCYMEPSAGHFKAMADRLYPDTIEVMIDQFDQHAMRPELIAQIFNDLAE